MQEAGNKVRDFFQRYGRTQLASALDRIATDNRAQEEKEATRHAAWESFCLKLAAAGVTKLPSYYDYSRGC